MVDSLIIEVAIKHKEVAVILTPPLGSLGFLSTELAPKEKMRKVLDLKICLAYNLAAYYGAGFSVQAVAYSTFSVRRYDLLAHDAICPTLVGMA